MCGIAGYYIPQSGQTRLSPRVDALSSTFHHRGPDSNGVWRSESEELFFFHGRLAIQDLSPSGHQPMLSSSGALCISFNGEIYNFHEMRARVQAAGAVLRGHSDTEVLLEYIERFGLQQALDAATGMFAFSLYDRRDKRLYLVRDRVGEKPLYWCVRDGVLAWASEIKGLRSMLGGLGDVDPVALGQYFRYGYVPEPRAMYRSVRKLPPGAMMALPLENLALGSNDSLDEFSSQYIRTYWSLMQARQSAMADPFTDREQALDAIHRTLKRNIANQSIADVSVGVFLSGGIDSTLVTALLQRHISQPVKSFTIAFEDPAFNEAEFARELARHIGTEHHEFTVTESQLLGVVNELPALYDEPLANASQIPTLVLCRYAREHVTVALSGDGGDELFGGYNRYLWGNRVARFNKRVPFPLRKMAGRTLGIGANLGAGALVSSALGRGPVQNASSKLSKLARALSMRSSCELYDFLLTSWYSENPVRGNPNDYLLPHEGFDHEAFIDAAMLSDQLRYLPGDNLAKMDRASMAASLEVRLPLLSHDLLVQAWRIPLDYKLKGGKSKSILRDILNDYVPAALIERPKMGFSVPIGTWLRGALRPWAEDLLASRQMRESDLLDSKVIQRAWRAHLAGREDHSWRLWTALLFIQWLAEA